MEGPSLVDTSNPKTDLDDSWCIRLIKNWKWKIWLKKNEIWTVLQSKQVKDPV